VTTARIEQLLRELAPQVLAILVRQQGDFDVSEDAVQEALLAAATQWPGDGVPDKPKAWLITVASRRRIELWRNESARRRREQLAAQQAPPPEPVSEVDDTLTLLLLCCHPSLTPVSQVALTLRAVGGLNTAEIARAFLVPEATVGQRISRAKQRIKASGAQFRMPRPDELSQRLAAVLHVLYLIFNEGYAASSGSALLRVELSAEAIRLTRQLRDRLPDDGEVAGLLALMLLTDARRPARTRPDGGLVALAEQDRSRWDAAAIAEGITLITEVLATAPIGPYQLQAAISAVHDEAARPDDTDWPQILGLYELLHTIAPGPMVTLNSIVAAAMVRGPQAGLHELDAAVTGSAADPALAGHHRVEAVRAHLLDMAGEHEVARQHYRLAARGTLSLPERRYLESRPGRPRSDAGDAVDGDSGDESGRRVLGTAGREDGVRPDVDVREILE
jgi:RNA polymerase sigma factor (sigma-70 family)